MKNLIIAAIVVGTQSLSACALHAHPPSPGAHFVWVAPHKYGHVHRPGHWKYVGPKRHGYVWIRGHYNRRGVWIRGHWSHN